MWRSKGKAFQSAGTANADYVRVTLKLSREASVEELGSEAERRRLGGHGENLGLYSVRWEPWEALGRGGTGPDFGSHRIPLPAA